jgi:hypothetical protein
MYQMKLVDKAMTYGQDMDLTIITPTTNQNQQ